MNPGARRIAVVGLTSWGLGLGLTLASAGLEAVLVARDPEEARALEVSRRHRRLPDVPLPASVGVTYAGKSAFAGVSAILLAVPAQRMRQNLRSLRSLLPAGVALVSASKGLESETHLRMSEVIAEEAGPEQRIAVLSGPNLVLEIVGGQPAAAVLASSDAGLATALQAMLATPRLRLYTSRDVTGVEIGGALKNVIALAVGLGEGMGYGDNARAALMTRGLAEIVRLGVAMGADPLTFAGLSGLGDLIATCASPLSRNHRAGRLLAKGLSRAEVEAEIDEVVEGITTTAAALALACRLNVAMPITEQLYRVLYQDLPPREAAATLMLRDLTNEPPI
jgi:glycerol-3-phosphate dehydrogenase (NAD(P)+)